MFWNIYSKRVLAGFRTVDTLVWTWIFPVVLATFFYFAFANLDAVRQLNPIPAGVVADRETQMAMESAGLFDVTAFTNAGDADAALENGEIDGYVMTGREGLRLVVTNDGLNQTIIKNFLDRLAQTKGMPAEPLNYTVEVSLSANPPNSQVNYFYALLAMVSLYGGLQGLITVTRMQANLSALGARRTMAPAGRFRMVACDLLGGITLHFICLLVVVAYIIFVLGVSFGSQLWLVLLACLAGSILGVAFGALVSVTGKLKEQAKIGVLIGVTMVCSFLSGLMVDGINYIVMQRAPAVAWLNPAARITDAFYALYYYDTYGRFFLNIGVILAMALAMFTVTSVFIGRQRYDSI